ncbi:sigma factor-like helix-turn-helix DNA-binding protein [Micromonospora chalcea]|uniref:sigma factor-like helix-turn-helix DNA-binding protein n=1 Tax=Micromonospora chalcea TaxID=1874 RepID=UPI003454594C
MVLLTSYSNHADQLGPLQDVLRRIAEDDQTEAPGLGGQAGAARAGRHRLTDRLTAEDQAAIPERYKAGATIKQLAGQFGLSESSVKRLLRSAGAGKHVRRA